MVSKVNPLEELCSEGQKRNWVLSGENEKDFP